MKIAEVLAKPQYFLLSIAISSVFFFTYVYLQVQGILENFLFWFTIVPYASLAAFILFVALLGVSFSYQVYLLRNPKVCAADVKKGTAGASSLGVASFFVSACPACASLGLLLLPASVLSFLVSYGIYINLASIAALLFMLNYLGAFRE